MEYRRLIKFGNSSYVVSVPKDWLKKNNLEKGDMIYLTENGNNEIVLSPKLEDTEPESLTYTVDIDPLTDQDLQRRIISKYIAGFDTFILIGEKTLRDKQVFIRNILNSLMALEVIEQTKSKVVAKDFLNHSEISFKTITRRIDTIIRSMFEDIKPTSEENSAELMKRDEDVNRLTYLTLRTIRKCVLRPSLAKKMEATVETLLVYREFVECLERIADELKRMSRSMSFAKNSQKQLDNFYSLFEQVYKLYIETMKAYYTKDEILAYELSKQREVLLDKILDISQNVRDPHFFLALEKLKTTIVLIRNILRILYRG